MPAIRLSPVKREDGQLCAGLTGSEWLTFDACLDRSMRVQLGDSGGEFPQTGLVSLRRGYDFNEAGERIVDEFRYHEPSTDDDTGEHVAHRFSATLFMEAAAFDRLISRLHWGLPDILLFFNLHSEAVVFTPGGDAEDITFNHPPRWWERVESATLLQQPWQ